MDEISFKKLMPKLKITILGAGGQLGSDLVKVLGQSSNIDIYPLTHQDIDILDSKNCLKIFDGQQPNIIINTAAYHKVDEVELNPRKAFATNAIAPKIISEYCAKYGIINVFISTDYVFGLDAGRHTPYQENDLPGPINVYGVSKLAGEHFTRLGSPKHFIIRTTGLFGVAGTSGKGGNFIERMIKLAQENKNIQVVDDQILSPTYTLDLANQLALLIKTGNFGTYHITSEGECSWYELTKEIFTLLKLKPHLSRVKSTNFTTVAKRPHYSALDNHNLKLLNLNFMHPWKESLKIYLTEKNYL
ncbi:MAG: dTDP-4-dehydrorhamnose reductase [Actinobacteria bacterium]|nr:dTDP-4-dehydrorhamnose reductase [Actinomycetota bacterium]